MSVDAEEGPGGSGTRFPFIDLEKAIGRAQQLYAADQKGREITIQSAFVVWEYSEKSSGGFQTISALKEYGLLRAIGKGKLQLSPEALLYFRDERESEHERLRMYFAHQPKLVQKLWVESKWGASPPADPVARSHLKNDIGLSEQSARSFLSIYKENIAFAAFKADSMPPEAKNTGKGTDGGGSGKIPPLPPKPPGDKVKVMDGERIAFTEEGQPGQYLKLIASGEFDATLLEALEDFVKRQKKRLTSAKSAAGGGDPVGI
jgi:hypothetical protein